MKKPNWELFFRHIVRFITHWYFIIIVCAIALSVAAFPRTKQLYSNIDTDLANLLPGKYESVQTIWQLRDKFKSVTSLIIVIEGPTIQETQDVMLELVKELKKDPKVLDVTYEKPGYDFFEKYALLYVDLDDLEEIDFRMDRRIQKEKLGGLYIDFEEDDNDDEFKFGDIEEKYKERYSSGAVNRYFSSDDGKVYAIYVKPTHETEGISGQRKFYDHIRKNIVDGFEKRINDDRFKFYYTGSIRSRTEEYRALLHDLAIAGIISGLGIALVLFLFFRRIFAVGFMLAPLAFGILSTFAIASFFLHSLNLVTSFLFMILGGLGVEIGIHLVSRYLEERREGKDMQEALFIVLYHTGGSALTSALTVAVTFLILMINDFKGFSEFGFIAGMGLIINYFAYIVLLPALLVLAEKLKLLAVHRSVGFVFAEKPNAAKRFPRPKFGLVGIGILTIISIIDIPQLQFEWRFKELKAHIPNHEIAMSKQRLTSSSVNKPAMVFVHNKKEADAVEAFLDKEKKDHPNTTVINAYKSYWDLVPDDQAEKLVVVDRMKKRLEDDTIKLVKGENRENLDRFKDQLAKTETVHEKDVPDEVKKLFWGDDLNQNEQVIYINPLPQLEMDNGRNAIVFAKEIGKIETPVGTFYPSNDAIVFADVLTTMMSDGKRAIALAFLCVFVIVFLDFRSVKETVMIVSPIALGVLFMALFMYIFKIKFNFYNMVIAPTVVGTSIDNSVHIYHRYKELGKTNLMTAVRSTGGASLLSSATNICGFLGLAFVNHAGLRSIGDLAVLGMSACLLTTLIFFPALLQYLEDRRNSAHAAA